ncbi:MAG TPA: PD-(D/E)XK nuclease family protein [Thermoplasmata archaeon]|nr:PD-(D/E)XK nuclease family protein [Thermoplasmata archaeon]
MGSVPALSYSSISSYLECPLRWKYLYVDRLPEAPRGYFSFGRTVHSVLEALLRPLVVPGARRVPSGRAQTTLEQYRAEAATSAVGHLMSREELLALYRSEWVGDGYVSTEEEARYRALGEQILVEFHDQVVAAPPQPVAVEAHLESAWDGIPVHGYIDRIDRTARGGLEILDYKTSREISMGDVEESDQLALYQVLVEHNYPDPVERLTLYHLRSQKPITSAPRASTALDELHERVTLVRDGIRSEVYEPTPGRQCNRCEFRPICPEFREVPAADRARLKELVDRFESLRSEERHLSGELARTAEELHLAAERLGVRRIPGSQRMLIRRREEEWIPSPPVEPSSEPPQPVDATLDPPPPGGPGAARTGSRPRSRGKSTVRGSRRVRWYWELDEN